MLPEYYIHEELEKIRRERQEDNRPRLEIPTRMPWSYNPSENWDSDYSNWNDFNRNDQEACEGEIIIKM